MQMKCSENLAKCSTECALLGVRRFTWRILIAITPPQLERSEKSNCNIHFTRFAAAPVRYRSGSDELGGSLCTREQLLSVVAVMIIAGSEMNDLPAAANQFNLTKLICHNVTGFNVAADSYPNYSATRNNELNRCGRDRLPCGVVCKLNQERC